MWSLAVVMLDIDAEYRFEVTAVEDQQPVQALDARGPHKALRDRVGLRCSHGRLQDSDALAAEHLVEGAAVLAVAVADQGPDALVGEVEAEVARLLGSPRAGRIPCAPSRALNTR